MAKRAQNIPKDEETVITSLRMTRKAELLRMKAATILGITKTAVIELAIREFTEKRGITLEDE